MNKEDAKVYDDAIADIVCWYNGFEDAAKMMDRYINGVGCISTLEKLRAHLKSIAYGENK